MCVCICMLYLVKVLGVVVSFVALILLFGHFCFLIILCITWARFFGVFFLIHSFKKDSLPLCFITEY